MLKILRFTLKTLAKLILKKYQPGIIGITGSVGKTSCKEALKIVFQKVRQTRASKGNFNNEIGLPLTILGDFEKIEGKFFWLKVIFCSLKNLIFRTRYPEILILEYAADRPGDIAYLLKIAQPQIGVATAIGEVPVHVEFYSSPEALAKEEMKLITNLPETGFAVLNTDDEQIKNLVSKIKAKTITYGFFSDAQMKISNFEVFDQNQEIGIIFKLEYAGNVIPVKMKNTLGKGAALSIAAASCVGLIFGLNLIEIIENLSKNFSLPPGRMNLFKGVKNTLIIDDTYNASPLSMKAALETLKELPGQRKIAVLGDMLEIGKYTLGVHEEIGRIAANFVDLLFTIGPRAKFIAEGAKKAGFPNENIFSYIIAEQAKKEVELKIREGDLVLIKASRAIGLEKVVEEIRER